MFLKQRKIPIELEVYNYLQARTDFSEDENNYYGNLAKGFLGEVQFDEWLQEGSINLLILCDLLFEVTHTTFQIDSLGIAHNKIYLFEIKNYEGDFYLEADRWYTMGHNEIKSPVLQLKRSESLLRQFLKDIGVMLPIESCIIFMNPEFHLYNSSRELPIVFPSQLNRFKNKLHVLPAVPRTSHQIAQKIVSHHMNKSRFTRVPAYQFDQLRKGIVCCNCGSIATRLVHKNALGCDDCQSKEEVDAAVLRSVQEFRLLFPERMITTTAIYEWCGMVVSRRAICRILKHHFLLVGKGKSCHYQVE
ncbi:nuclease-related domain-containing protein [Falsibacillus pallidus]|uniref:Nuclease-like protein n=1 Tax=Falsibacillus pallidus TaxID=493781 RepID=A0A370GWH0_9BACI|nr:nuclease-related domain-containing protein [Falsibacillus pallidus]RDI48035.1 nuclease-like protein [Falsibacillus pallidus]